MGAARVDPATAAIRATLRTRAPLHAHDLRLERAGPPRVSAARVRYPSHALAHHHAAQGTGVTAARLQSRDLPHLGARELEATLHRVLLLLALDPEATVARRVPCAVVVEAEATHVRHRLHAKEADADHPRLQESAAFLAPLLHPAVVRDQHRTIHALPQDLRHLAAVIVDRLRLVERDNFLRVAGTPARWKGHRRPSHERRRRQQSRTTTRWKTSTQAVVALWVAEGGDARRLAITCDHTYRLYTLGYLCIPKPNAFDRLS